MEPRHKPFAHQREEYETHGTDAARGVFWEQGTGKSKLVIDEAVALWEAGKITGVLVVAPNGVHRNWTDSELPEHLPEAILPVTRAICVQTSKAGTKRHVRQVDEVLAHDGFVWLTVSYDGFMTAFGHGVVARMFRRCRGKLLYVLDEAHYTKTPKAERTKSILRSAKYADFRRALTGTPVTQGPFDLYSIIRFLDEDYWERTLKISTFTAFKEYFGVWRMMRDPRAGTGREFKKLVRYQRTEELAAAIKPIVTRVTKDKVLDLPPKLYQKRLFSMSPEQARLYKELRDEFVAWVRLNQEEIEATTCSCGGTGEVEVEGMVYPCPACAGQNDGDTPVVATLAMVRLLRLQQVTCGFLPTDDGEQPVYKIPGPDPRLEAVLEVCETAQHKVIVWSRFKLGVTAVLEGLAERGISAVRYDGEVSTDGRADSLARFTGIRPRYVNGQVVARDHVPEAEQAKVFVGNQATGSTGLTLVQGKTVVYHANDFKLGNRQQSEDRCHRIGQVNQVLYIDMIAEGTVDQKIVRSLREKRDVSIRLLGDEWKEWI